MIQCNYCNSTKYKKHYHIQSSLNSKIVSYYKCKRCGSIMQYPLPDENTIKEYYDNYKEIKKNMNPGYLDQQGYNALKNERNMTLREIGFNTKAISNRTNIELGCANGHFLRYLVEMNSKETIGIDISDELLNSIHLDGVTLINGSLADIKTSSCDTLFLFNVLEHIPDIQSLMENIVRIVKHDSSIIIEVPLSGLVQNFFGAKWRFFMPDEHIQIPSKKGLIILLKRFNLKVTGYTRFGSGFTSGMINPFLKRILDFSAKKTKCGDRGTFFIQPEKNQDL